MCFSNVTLLANFVSGILQVLQNLSYPAQLCYGNLGIPNPDDRRLNKYYLEDAGWTLTWVAFYQLSTTSFLLIYLLILLICFRDGVYLAEQEAVTKGKYAEPQELNDMDSGRKTGETVK